MSLINHMLRDLERRRAELPGATMLAVGPLPTPPPATPWPGWKGLLLSMGMLALTYLGYHALPEAPPRVVQAAPPPALPSLRYSGQEEPPLTLRESRQLDLPTVEPEPQPEPEPAAPPPPATLTRVGEMLQAGQRRPAEKLLRHSLQINQGDQPSRLLLARLLWEDDRRQEATRLLTSGPPGSGDSETARLLAHFQVQQERLDEALATLQRAATALGWEKRLQVADDPELASFMANLHQQRGEHRQAVHWYDALLHDNPRESNHWLGMAISLEALDAGPEARQAYRRALDGGHLTPPLADYARERLQPLGSHR